MTCDQDHNYKDEQSADDHGSMDMFVQDTGRSETLAQCLAGQSFNGSPEPVPAGASSNYAVMDYFDGNTVTALWNLAQQYAMSDNSYTTNFGPSTPGAFNVTSAQTYGAICGPASATINDSPCTAPSGLDTITVTNSDITGPAAQDPGPGTNYSDADPTYDICTYLPSADGGDGRSAASSLTMGGGNIGTALDAANVTWGWFEGGFDNGYAPGHGTPPTTAQICAQSHTNVGGNSVVDYIPHHEPFQYYAATANPMHLPPASVAMIGQQDQANHQYDLADFWAAAESGHLPQVSFLKAPAYQHGHAGYSDPLDEQAFLADTIDHLQARAAQLVVHRRRDRLRRLRRLVRPRARPDHLGVADLIGHADRCRNLRHPASPCQLRQRSRAGPLRRGRTGTAARRVAVVEVQLRSTTPSPTRAR